MSSLSLDRLSTYPHPLIQLGARKLRPGIVGFQTGFSSFHRSTPGMYPWWSCQKAGFSHLLHGRTSSGVLTFTGHKKTMYTTCDTVCLGWFACRISVGRAGSGLSPCLLGGKGPYLNCSPLIPSRKSPTLNPSYVDVGPFPSQSTHLMQNLPKQLCSKRASYTSLASQQCSLGVC